MEYFAIISTDVPNSAELRASARPAHLGRLEQLASESRLLTAGPTPKSTNPEDGIAGSLVIAKFEDLAAAQEWADADPYVNAGVYASVEIKHFKQVF